LYSILVGSVGMGARLLVSDVLEDDLLVVLLLLFELVCEDVGIFVEVLTAKLVEGFTEVVELAFLLVEEDLAEDFGDVLAEDGLTDDFGEDFTEVLVLNCLLVEDDLTEDFEDVLAAS
jgi:hypothetical protein